MGSTFNGTPFNNEQLDYMRSLAKIPPEKLSWCGWGRAGDPFCCGNPDCIGKKEGKTLADKMKVWCQECQNAPWPDGTITHVITCSRRATEPSCGETEPKR